MKKNNIDELIEFIASRYCDEDETMFYGCLMVLKKYIYLGDVERESMIKLVNILPSIKDALARITLIEIIVEFLCFQNGENHETGSNEELIYNNIEELLDEYILCLLSENVIDTLEVRYCLGNFIDLGISKNELFNNIAGRFKRRDVIQVMMGMWRNWSCIPKEFENLYEESRIGEKISERSGIILSFILIVHPLGSKYEYCNNLLSVSPASSLLSAIIDWGWVKEGSTNYLVKEKIITKEEGKILEKLGQLIHNNIELESEEIRKLYYKFFNDKDPFDVMFTLPE